MEKKVADNSMKEICKVLYEINSCLIAVNQKLCLCGYLYVCMHIHISTVLISGAECNEIYIFCCLLQTLWTTAKRAKIMLKCVQAEVCRFGVVGLLVGRATVDSAGRQAGNSRSLTYDRLLPLAYVHSKQLLTSTVWSNARAFLCRGVVMVLLIFPCCVGFIVGCIAAAALYSLHLTTRT